MQGGERYNSINDYLKTVFGRKTVKLSIDAGFTCPNRDGSKGRGGCAFCSEGGSGELASHMNFNGSEIASDLDCLTESVKVSIESQIEKISDKWPDANYIAYFQSFSNTYAPVHMLSDIYYTALDDPRICGIAIATRVDCLPADVLDLLEEISQKHFMWVELGLQSIHRKTQESMNMCYTTDDYDSAVRNLAERNIRFVTHLILGLPDESKDMMIESVRYVSGPGASCYAKSVNASDYMESVSASVASGDAQNLYAPITPFGIKLHMMNLVKTTTLYKTMPDYVSFASMDEYVNLVVECLENIPPDITIHRLSGDVPRSILVSPEWSYKKRSILNAINRELKLRDTRQGANLR